MTKGDKERYRVQAAIAAMASMISSEVVMRHFDEMAIQGGSLRRDKAFAKDAVKFSDALMAELGLGEEE